METRSRMSRSLHTNRDFEKLEPYEGKPSRTVLRGEEGSNALDLPDNFNILKLDGAIIGSGSIVTHGISAKALAVGRPMKVIRTNVEWK